MKNIFDKLNESGNYEFLNVNDVNLFPCMYEKSPAILIGDPIKYYEKSFIKKYQAASLKLHKYARPLDDFFDEDEIPDKSDYYGLIYYSDDDGRSYKVEWINMQYVDYEF